ncbi:MAG: VOC family protein [Chloroflexi bacterium]|nr:VOC family protein [Chloroflexota bacterium]
MTTNQPDRFPSKPALVPEFAVTDIDRSVRFYVDVLGFSLLYDRPEERFAYLVRRVGEREAHVMLEEHGGRSFHSAALEHPYGRGSHLQIEVSEVAPLWAAVQDSGAPVVLPLEDRWYRRGDGEVGNRQFVTQDPDGYVLRFFESLGAR